jgi:hypothetical protein
VAHLVHHGEGGGDPAEAARWYRRAAEQGHAGAQNNLGLLYEEGRGVEQDLSEAGRWYRLAAERGLVAGQVNLARMYEEGRGTAQDFGQAARWYRQAADQGHAEAQYRLGRLYGQGQGVQADAKKAARWYRKAAHRGHLQALDALAPAAPAPDATGQPAVPIEVEAIAWDGETLEPEEGSEPEAAGDVEQARAAAPPSAPVVPPSPPGEPSRPGDELRERALAGDAESQYQLGLHYSLGRGVARSLPEAGRWFREAARAGHALAAYRLALLAMRGLGLWEHKDFVAAHRWFSLAAAQGVGDAVAWRDRIAAKMTREELAESARLQEQP